MRCATTLCWPTASAERWSVRAAMSPGCASPAGRTTASSRRCSAPTGAMSCSRRAGSCGGGFYEPGTLIWRSRWVTTDAIVECREALALPSRRGRAVLLRRIEVLEGTARMDVRLRMRGDWGREPVRDLRRDPDGAWRGRAGTVDFAWHPGAAAHGDASELGLELDPRRAAARARPAAGRADRSRATAGARPRRSGSGACRSSARRRPARCAARRRGAGGADRGIRRDGRRGNDGAT